MPCRYPSRDRQQPGGTASVLVGASSGPNDGVGADRGPGSDRDVVIVPQGAPAGTFRLSEAWVEAVELPERVVVAGVRPVPGLEVARAVGAADVPERVVVARLVWLPVPALKVARAVEAAELPERVVVAGLVRPVPGLEVARAVEAAELPEWVVVADHATLRLRWAQFSC